MLLFLVWDQWITNLSSFTHFHWPISLLIWISKESPDESWPSSSPVQLDLFFLPAQIQLSRSVSPPTSQLSKRDFKRTSKVCQWEIGKSLLGNISSISFFIIYLQPFQCHFLANKSYFPSFTFKKKFRVDQPKIKKLSNPIFQLVSPSESIMHPPCGQHWALLCVLALVSAWETFLVTWQAWHWHWAALGKKAAGRAGGGLSDGENETGSREGSP